MPMFGRRPFMPSLQAAMAGQIPGAMVENWNDPYFLAQQIGASVPADPPAPQPEAGAGPHYASPPRSPGKPYLGGQPPPEARVPVNGGASPARRMDGEAIPVSAAPRKKNSVGNFLTSFAGFYGDALTGNPVYAKQRQQQAEMEETERAARIKANSPQQVGNSIIVPDGRGGYKTLFRDPSTPEAWAEAQGFQPGTGEYAEAVRQYRLGSWSDEAVAAKTGLTGYRYDRQGNLQEDRQEHATGMQDDRQGHSDRQLGRRLDVTRRGQNITHGNNVRSTGQSDTNNQRSTDTSRDNSIRSNETRLQTAGGRRGGTGAPVRVNTLEQARRLRPGTLFQTPDGRIKVR